MNAEALVAGIWLRLALALAIILAGLCFYWLANRASLARARAASPGLRINRRGVPVLLYFTTPACAPCKTVQRPAIQRLRESVGDRLEVVEIDAAAEPELASRWGVLSVPTTFILDRNGAPRHVNHGVVATEKLLRQLSDLN